MKQTSTMTRLHWAIAIAVSLLAGCGGGGGEASNVIAPYWVQGGVVVADFNGDGHADVAVAKTYIAGPPPHPGYVDIYLQTAAGIYAPPVQYAVGPDPWGLSVGDVDGDGRLDLVAATPMSLAPEADVTGDSGGVAILRQDRARPGFFLSSVWLATGGSADHAAISDLNADGLPDLVVADGVLANGRALLFLQRPSLPGEFAAPASLLAGNGRGAKTVAVADMNGDGRNDVILAAQDGVVIFYQLATGGFGPATVLAAGIAVSGVAVADLDGDVRLDVVAANAGNAPSGGTGGSTVTALLQTAPSSFIASNLVVADGARRVAIGDVNGDRIPDIVVVSLVYQAQKIPSLVSGFLQSPTSRGQFAAGGVYDGPYTGDFVAIGDVNGDGLNDIVVNDGPSVLLQRATAPGTFTPVSSLR